MQSLLPFMLAGALLGTGLAIAQSPAEEPPKNKSPGYLAKFDQLFKSADKDGDNALSKTEAEDARMERVVASFDRLDADKDDRITRNEIRALIRHRLSS